MAGPNSCKLCKTFREPKGESDSCLLPLVSESNFFGPSIDETVLYLISLLPKKLLDKIGYFHETEDLVELQDKKCTLDLDKWLKDEFMALAKEVAECGWNTNDTCGRVDTQMLESRRFVLNRLAELMEKKTEIERCLNQQNLCDKND